MKTDTQLQLDVIAELGWEPSISAAHIGVEVRHGIVTLAGMSIVTPRGGMPSSPRSV